MNQVNRSISLTGVKAIVNGIVAEKVDTIFTHESASITDLVQQLKSHSLLKNVCMINDKASVHAADGYTKATGKTGVAVIPQGSGITNAVTALGTAQLDSIPIVVIASQVSEEQLGNDAFQEVDTFGVTTPVVKYHLMVSKAEDIQVTIREAFHIAETGRPGPVVVTVTSNVFSEKLLRRVNLPRTEKKKMTISQKSVIGHIQR